MPSDTVSALAAASRTRVLTTPEELDAEASGWAALDEAAATPAQQLAWALACAASFSDQLRIVLVEAGAELLAAAPLAVREDGSLELVGARELYEPADFAYRDEESLQALARALVRLKTGVVIPRLYATSPTAAALRRAFRGRGMLIVRPAGATPVLGIGDDPEARFSVRRRGDLRRARRRAEAIGAVTAEVLAPGTAELTPLLDELFAVEAAGWKGERGTALAQDPKRRRFFEAYAAATAAQGSLRLCLLRIGEEVAAVQLAVEHAHRLWLLKIGYDERFARCSPGTLLLLETARWASGNGLEAIELLGEREPWTRFWTDEERACVAVHAYPATLRGVGSLVTDAAGHTRRRLAQRVIDRAARAHVAGSKLDDALAASREVAAGGSGVALAYWDAPEDSPQRVESISIEALEALAGSGLDAYLSLKPAALGFARARIESILSRAVELGVPIHFDSTGPADAEPSWKLLSEIAAPGVGCTLPSGWRRSLIDAGHAIELGLRVRIVKGQWPEPEVDEEAGFLALVDAIAGRAPHVAVATHDRSLAEQAIQRLEAAGTHFEHELMFGLPRRGDALGPTRVYIPFGHPYLPYAPGRARRNARVAGWVVRDFLRG